MRAQDNVASLLRLADKYDMAAVRSTCAAFLVGRKNDMSLHEPLESPKNLLHAASLVERYLSSRSTPLQAALQEHATPIASLLQHTLQAVHICHWTHTSDAQAWNTWKSHARGVVTGLNKSVRHRRYGDIVTVAVQVRFGRGMHTRVYHVYTAAGYACCLHTLSSCCEGRRRRNNLVGSLAKHALGSHIRPLSPTSEPRCPMHVVVIAQVQVQKAAMAALEVLTS